MTVVWPEEGVAGDPWIEWERMRVRPHVISWEQGEAGITVVYRWLLGEQIVTAQEWIGGSPARHGHKAAFTNGVRSLRAFTREPLPRQLRRGVHQQSHGGVEDDITEVGVVKHSLARLITGNSNDNL